MKTIINLAIVLVFSVSQTFAQEKPTVPTPYLGDNAPSFTAESTNGTINFPKDFGSNWKIIFSHPADFTPVCSSELLELSALQEDFRKMHVDIVIVSTDNVESHAQWVKSLESIEYKNRKTEKISFPLVADQDHSIAKKYGMIHPNTSSTKDVRGVFIIDPKNTIRAMFYYPMNIGRNTDEIKRTIVALQTADKNNVLTPADWQAGNDVLVPFVKNSNDQGNLAKTEGTDTYQVSWYMVFKKM
jgi:peroxiredoxin 2/4